MAGAYTHSNRYTRLRDRGRKIFFFKISYVDCADGAGGVSLDELDLDVDLDVEVLLPGAEAGALRLVEGERQRLGVAIHEEVGAARAPDELDLIEDARRAPVHGREEG